MIYRNQLLQIVRYVIGDCEEIINPRKSLRIGIQNPEIIMKFIERSINQARRSASDWEKALKEFKNKREQ